MKKKTLLLLIFLLVCGCTNRYTITFNDDKIDEEVIVNILDNSIPTLSETAKQNGIELDDQLTPFIEGDQYPFFGNNDIKYEKTIEHGAGQSVVTLKYSYKPKEFNKSQAMKKCFSDASFTENENQYSFSATGKFYCLYADEIEVNFITDKKVLDHNANKVSGNKYTWIINNDNYKNVNINIQLSKGTLEKRKTRANMILMIIGLILLLIGLTIYMKIRKNQKNSNTF